MLADFSCQYVIVGHSERRAYHHESNELVAQKALQALRSSIFPIVCVGETLEQREAGKTNEVVVTQLRAVMDVLDDGALARIVVAYEPVWAIGAAEPAGVEHIVGVCVALREHLATTGREGTVIYGGSAGPGLLTRLGDGVDGLFLGRFAHDPAALAAVLDEAAA